MTGFNGQNDGVSLAQPLDEGGGGLRFCVHPVRGAGPPIAGCSRGPTQSAREGQITSEDDREACAYFPRWCASEPYSVLKRPAVKQLRG